MSAYIRKGELDLNKIMPFSDCNEAMWIKYSPVDLSAMTVKDFIAIKPSIIMQLVNAEGNKLLVKTHDANIDAKNHYLIPALFTLGAIYIIRDPRDIVTSLSYHTGITVPEAVYKLIDKRFALAINNKKEREHELHSIITSWNNHVNSWTKGALYPVFMIRYEDMSRKPKYTFKAILKYLDIKYDKNSFKKAMKETKFGRMQMKEKKDGFNEHSKKTDTNFFRKGKAEGWRTELPKHLVYKIEEQCHEQMEKYGYNLSRPFGKYRYEKAEKTFRGHEHRKLTT